MRWAGHVACTGDDNFIQILVGKPTNERDHLEDLSIDGKIALN
jgi:hypothetical protein